MKRCSKCKQEKDESEFSRLGNGLQYWCKKCHRLKIRAIRKKEKDEKFTEEKLEKVRQTIFRSNVLNQPSFIYQNGYTLNVIPMYENFKIEICAGQEEMAVLVPADRMELLRNWLNVKIRAGKQNGIHKDC